MGRKKRSEDKTNVTIWVDKADLQAIPETYPSKNSFIGDAIKEKLCRPSISEEKLSKIKEIVNQ